MSTLAALASVTLAKGITGFVGNRQAATGAERQADYESGVLGLNAEMADRAADDAVARGREAQNRSRLGTRQLIGAQRATLAGQGLQLEGGTASDLQLESQQLGELDTLTIANNAMREAFGFKVEAVNYRSQANLTRLAGKNTAANYRNQGYTTLLTTGAELGDLAYRYAADHPKKRTS